MYFLKLLRWGQDIIVLYAVEKACVSLLVDKIYSGSPNQEHWDGGKIQGWMCEQREQVLNLSLEMVS